MTLGQFKLLFQMNYSAENTPVRALEEATYINFVDFLDKCEGISKFCIHFINFSVYIQKEIFVST